MTDYTELVKALRCCGSTSADCTVCPWDKYTFGMCAEKLLMDAAAAIEELQAEVKRLEPKRGEWIGVSPMVDTVQCSVCGGQLFSAELKTPYCPYCGAEMEVQK